MKKLTLLILACLVAFNIAEAQITRQQADALVTNQIFSSSLDNVDIYAFPKMHTSADVLTLLGGETIAIPYSTCWTYVINTSPMENWHDTYKFVFVNADNCSYSIVESDMPLTSFQVGLDVVSLMPWPSSVNHLIDENYPIAATNEHLWAILICSDYKRSGACEVYDKRTIMSDLSCVYTTLTNVYGFKEQDELAKRHIFVITPDDFQYEISDYDLNHSGGFCDNNDFGEDFFYDKDNQNLEFLHEYFKIFAGESPSNESLGLEELTEEDQLFIYFTGKSNDPASEGSSYIEFTGKNHTALKLYDDVFASWLRGIKCSQISLMVQNPHSEGFVEKFLDDISNDDCRCKNRIGHSSSSFDGYAYGEYYKVYDWMEGGRDDGSGFTMVDEFTYYWASAHLGYYPILNIGTSSNGYYFVDGPWNAYQERKIGVMDWSKYFPGEVGNNSPHRICEGLYDFDHDGIISMKEAFDFANRMDTWSDDTGNGGIFNPRYPEFLEYPNPYCVGCRGPEIPQEQYESSFTAEAATLVGYQGQVDGDVTSGTAEQPYRLVGDLWTGPHTRVDMTDDIYVPEGNKIYIQPSSYIQLRNCTADKLPEAQGMWEGFQVWGQSGEPQDLQHQGALYMDNASIRNAVVAVDLWHPNYWHSMGGTVRANNSSFINNGKAIHALNCVYESTAFMPTFSNCRFYVGNDNGETYFGPTTFYKHVDLANVRGVKFYGCDFGLDCVNSFISDWTIGIAAYNAGFEVEKLGNKRSTFNGFFRGVQALNDGTITRSFSVKNSDFTNNDYGIFARAADESVILNNTFSIGLDNWYSCAAGIQLEGISNFVVEGNAVTKEDNYRNDNFGIIIKDSQTEGSQVYLNDLDGLYCGNLAWGDNRGNNNDLGLKYYCNSNADNSFDFYVKKIQPNDNFTDIQQEQGSLDYDPHNTFSDGHNLISNFYNDGEHIVDYHFVANSSDGLELYRVRDAKANALYDCQPHYGGGGNAHNGSSTPVLSSAQKQQRQTDYANALNTYNSVKNVYDRLTDGGSTNSTVADIRSAMPSDMWELRSKLLGSSPYLSEEVLKETADRDDVFTESILFEILASNPDELKKGDIIKYVEDKEHPLPEYMVDILRQLSTGTTTYKTLLLNSMASSRHDYRQAAADMVRNILADSIVDMNELRGWLANMNDLSADRQIISTYMAEGDYGTAFSLANMLPTLYEFDATALAEHDDYMELLGLYRDLHNDGRSTLQLTESETEDVEDIAINGTGLPQYMAQSLLEATTERYHFAECPLIDEPSGMGRGVPQGYTQEDLSKAMGLAVSAKPNPATTWVAIDFTLPGDAKTAAVEIVNSLGEKVMYGQLNGNVGQKVLDLRELSNGVYTITILCGEYYQTEKLVVAK